MVPSFLEVISHEGSEKNGIDSRERFPAELL